MNKGKFIFNFNEININNLPEVGGKNASLGEMITKLTQLHIKVPNGFATSAEVYRLFLKENNLGDKIYDTLRKLDVEDVNALKEASESIKSWIMEAKLSPDFEKEVAKAYKKLNLGPEQTVAVRSSATAEDLPEASFAGQQETFLNIDGIEAVLTAIKGVYASLFTPRAIAYRVHHGFEHDQVAISAGIQKMIRSDKAVSGVVFTIDTESGFDQVVFVTASYGLGETIVQGSVNPDEFYVHKPTLKEGKRSIVSRKLGSKEIKMIYSTDNNDRIKIVDVDEKAREQFCLTDDEILELAKQAMVIEDHYGKAMDIEWAKDGIDNTIYIIQARPETVKTRESRAFIEQYQLQEKAEPILTGRSVGQKIGQGKVNCIKDVNKLDTFQAGEILVADITDPDWEPIMKLASAIVTNRGGRTCHAAIVARELGIPAVVGCGNATTVLEPGDEVTVCCAEGETGFIYPGLLKFNIEKTAIDKLPEIPVKLCMNLANPEQAFQHQFLPNDGIGLARIEFIISNMIGLHPNALLSPDKITEKVRNEIQKRTSAYESPVEFYIEKLAEGVATIAAAFYPKTVIVRFSDFKSNEYANLLGGEFFEPDEENPMLGYRGGARYVSGDFQPCYALECEAIKRVREEKGLTNTHVMFPFVRTVNVAKELIETTKKNGLERGKNGLKIYMMCEIPSNGLLAEEFLQYFDGYSIGSNDLTQLTLGLDRDSELVADLFDERDPAVKALLHEIISTCNRLDKYVGICGQGPSDHLDFAKWLVDEGIGSLSLTPDSILRTWLALGNASK